MCTYVIIAGVDGVEKSSLRGVLEGQNVLSELKIVLEKAVTTFLSKMLSDALKIDLIHLKRLLRFVIM